MTRVSNNSQSAALQFALNRAKRKMEDLQIQGSTLRQITRPSDNPIGTTEVLHLKSASSDNEQYQKNIQHALLNLNTTEQAIEQLTEIMVKAKEIAINQASDFYDEDIRRGVANEVKQLRNQALAISNKRIGQRYIFGGFKTLEKPFNNDGTYNGDNGHTTIEVAKDFFIPINLHGKEVFYSDEDSRLKQPHPLNRFPDLEVSPNKQRQPQERTADPVDLPTGSRDLASMDDEGRITPITEKPPLNFASRNNIFSVLDGLNAALENNSSRTVQDLLPEIENSLSRLINLRTRIGSISNSIHMTQNSLEGERLSYAERKSHLNDADIAELFSDIQRQQAVLTATYQTSQSTLNQTLLDFLR